MAPKDNDYISKNSGTDTGGFHLSWIFWEHENLSSLSVLIYIKLYKEKKKNNFGKKSGLSRNPA